MFKKKDLAIAVAMALSVSPASLAQTDEEKTEIRSSRTAVCRNRSRHKLVVPLHSAAVGYCWGPSFYSNR